MAEHREPEQDSADDSALEGADFAQRESDSDTGVEIDRGVPESSELPYRVVNFRTRDEWLEWRKGKIGASDIGAIMGCSPFMTRFNLMRTKLGIYKKKSTLSMEKGIALEGHVLKMVNMRMQKQFLYTFQVSANPEMQQDLIRESEIFCTDLELCRLNSEPRNSSH
jgi:hypothetical protein